MKIHLLKMAILPGIISLISFSCTSLYHFKLSVLKPAATNLPQRIQKIDIINYSYVPNCTNFHDDWGKTITGVDSAFSWQYVNTLNLLLANSPRFEVKKIYSAPKSFRSREKDFDLKLADSICKKDSVDAAIILEKYFIDDIKSSENSNFYYSRNTVSSGDIVFWNIYDVKTHKIIDKYVIRDSINVYSISPYWGFGRSANILDKTRSSAIRAATNYAQRISPVWDSEDRYLYCLDNNYFNDAIGYIKQDNWDKAIISWKNCIGAEDKNTASEAAFNIAVAYETKDELNIAIEWAAKSFLLLNNPISENYIGVLENRIVNKKLLLQQLQTSLQGKPAINK
jgi:tetratricopeptide (TPR) repeat protein